MGLVKATQDQHMLDLREVEQTLLVCDAAVDATQRTRQQYLAQLFVRRLFLVPFWGFIGLMTLFLYWKRHRSEKGE